MEQNLTSQDMKSRGRSKVSIKISASATGIVAHHSLPIINLTTPLLLRGRRGGGLEVCAYRSEIGKNRKLAQASASRLTAWSSVTIGNGIVHPREGELGA